MFADADDLTERDRIALAVLAGFATSGFAGGNGEGAKVIHGDVERAYAYADAVLAKRAARERVATVELTHAAPPSGGPGSSL